MKERRQLYENCEEERMKKKSWIYRLLKKIGLIKSRELTEEELIEMCNRSVIYGVCPNDCERCAWNRRAEDAAD